MTGVKQRCSELAGNLRAQFLAGGDAAPVLRARSAFLDEVAMEAWSGTLGAALPEGAALLAVGGYGRRELFPSSDIDLLLLVREPLDDGGAREALSGFLRRLWDAGFKVGHSVRTPEECGALIEGNLELTISLLDERLLGGDPVVYGRFRERMARLFRSERNEIARRLCRMARARHARFHDTIYRLEPDVKEHPGGLRDLQTVTWLARLREQEVNGSTGAAHAFLCSVRCFLHFHAGRDANLLAFDAQDEIAEASFSRGASPEEWMRSYYRHARASWRAALAGMEAAEAQERRLLATFRDWRSRLSTADFTVLRDRVLLRNPHSLESDPELALRLFTFTARHGIAPAAETERRAAGALARLRPALAAQPPAAAWWREFVDLPHAPRALRVMQDSGWLAALLPGWDRIEHLVIRDYYHQYTVDEHTFVALESLVPGPAAGDAMQRRFAGLLEECESDAWLLRLALLFHDTGKGQGGEHEGKSAQVAALALGRMQATPEQAGTVAFLIEHHLALSTVLQTRDLSDPVTARSLAARVQTIERLRLLTLLTWADVSAVNQTAMTSWRAGQLWRLYQATAREFARELNDERLESEAEGELGEFLRGLPSRYLWTHTRAEAEAHLALARLSEAVGAGVFLERREGVWRAVVVTPDRPFLFASLAGTLASFGLNILHAEAFANRRAMVVDTFVCADPMRTLELNPPEVDRLRIALRKVASGELRADDLLKHRPVKPAPARRAQVPPAVGADNESSNSATLYEVVAQDRPGLLHALASAISRAGGNIEVVLVDTQAHRALDVFHVTKAARKLTREECEGLREALLDACRG